MIEAPVIPEQNQVDFNKRLLFLYETGVMDIVHLVSREHERLNDETSWQFPGRQYHGFREVRMIVSKPHTTDDGIEIKLIHLMYDGSSLRISAKNSRTFNLPIGIDIEEETRDNISEAIQ